MPHPLRIVLYSSMALALASCQMGPDYAGPPEIGAAPTVAGHTTPLPASSKWWEKLGDAKLNHLIKQAAENSPDLRAAEARLRQARSRRIQAETRFWPELTSNSSFGRQKESDNSVMASRFPTSPTGGGGFPASNNFQSTLDASWEMDVFGGKRRGVEAAEAEAQAALEAQRDVMLSLLAEVASNYVELRGLQERLTVVEASVKSQSETVELANTKLKAGIASELPLAQAQAQLASTRASVPEIEAGIQQARQRIAILMGLPPHALDSSLSAAKPMPKIPSSVPAGLDSELLLRRPDIRRAERQLAAAAARIGESRAAAMPKFKLTGSLGLQSSELSSLLEHESNFWSIGPAMSVPILDQKRLGEAVKEKEAARDEARAAYEQTALTAMQDVATALSDFHARQKKLSALNDAEKASRRSQELSTKLYDQGLGDFLSVLESQRTLLSSQEQIVLTKRQLALDFIKLNKSLGGSW